MGSGRDVWLPAAAALAIGAAFVAVVYAAMSSQVVDRTREASFPRYDGSLPSDFHFTYSYGIGLDYTLSAASNGRADFTAELCQGIITRHATLLLSPQELLSIWQSIQQNDFFGITEDFTQACTATDECMMVAPVNRKTLEVTADGETRKVEYSANYDLNNDNAQLDRFSAIVDSIDGVLAGYENLPQTDCRYA